MPQQPTTLTDQLANVVAVIQLGRKTGTLTVERGSGSSLERGTIHFVNGLMTQANTFKLKSKRFQVQARRTTSTASMICRC